MDLTPEQQRVYDNMSPERRAQYDEMYVESARVRALPIEDKVELLMERVGELIVIITQHQREFEALASIFEMMDTRTSAPTATPTVTESRPMPGQYL